MSLFRELKRYYEGAGLIPARNFDDFQCRFKEECRNTCKKITACAQAYVGSDYEVARILFIGMEYGVIKKDEPLQTMEQQRLNNERLIGNEREIELLGTNRHMPGTIYLLQRIFDVEASKCVLRYFALSNWVKCSSNPKTQRAEATKTMYKNCSTHILKEIEILQPRLIIFQGKPPSERFWTIVEENRGMYEDVIERVRDSKHKWCRWSKVRLPKQAEFDCLFLQHPSIPTNYRKWLHESGVDDLILRIRENLFT